MAFYYQVISRQTKYIQLANLAVMIMFLCLTIIAVPESPKWLVSKGRFTEAKESLERVARFNGQPVTKDDFVLENEDSVPDGDQSSNAS